MEDTERGTDGNIRKRGKKRRYQSKEMERRGEKIEQERTGANEVRVRQIFFFPLEVVRGE